ncbi:MAG: beta-N-acetylhexosaminidase [Rhodobacteraceae bacterium]|nr:beta-N-acetylhexosaminidase [Paracoccaceae bacterium]
MQAVIFGCEGQELSARERAFFIEADPWGLILFARNIDTPDQVHGLIENVRSALGRTLPVLIDQEGGRVARLAPPIWKQWAPARDFCDAAGARYRAAMYLRGRMIAAELFALGIDVNCAPILDLAGDDTHAIIKNRCYGTDPGAVAKAGRALSEGQAHGGVLSVIKHIPGHGRGNADSHLGLPRVDTGLEELRSHDFAPFKALSDLPMAMTAHIVYEAIDPELPATLSPAVIREIRSFIGFSGLLITDDLSMNALGGAFGERARRVLGAGCDMILHCNGNLAEMEPVAANTPRLDGLSLLRADAALARRQVPDDFDPIEGAAALKNLMGDISRCPMI